jgi:hypothetical protein
MEDNCMSMAAAMDEKTNAAAAASRAILIPVFGFSLPAVFPAAKNILSISILFTARLPCPTTLPPHCRIRLLVQVVQDRY